MLNYYNAGPNGLKDHYPLDTFVYGSAGSANRDLSSDATKEHPLAGFDVLFDGVLLNKHLELKSGFR